MCSCFSAKMRDCAGQATVEAAFLIPIILLCLLLLIQPGILLYDRMVMHAAAAEGCRLLQTKTSAQPVGDDAYEAYVRRRLASIPSQDNFHVHASGCSYLIAMQGNESSEEVSVSIENKVKLLPFFDAGSHALGLTDTQGNVTLKVEVKLAAKNDWIVGNELGMDPEAWVHQWD